MPCPSEATLGRFASGELPDAEIRELETHLDTCGSCRRAVVALARMATHHGDASPAPLDDTLPAGYTPPTSPVGYTPPVDYLPTVDYAAATNAGAQSQPPTSETLRERLARGPLPPQELLLRLRTIVGALVEAHGRGVLHGHLDPTQILLPTRGASQVIGFDASEREAEPAFRAPEQWQGTASAASDIWAFGVILFELLSGQLPFNAADSVALRAQITSPEPIAPLDCDPSVAPLGALVSRCLQKDPALRPTAAQLLARLDGVGAEPRRRRPAYARWAGNLLVLSGTLVGYFAAAVTASLSWTQPTAADYVALLLLGGLPALLAALLLGLGLWRGRGTTFHFVLAALGVLLGLLFLVALATTRREADVSGFRFVATSALYWFGSAAVLISSGVQNRQRLRDDERA